MPRRVLVLGLGSSGEAVAAYAAGRRAQGEDITVTALDEDAGPVAARRAARFRELGAEVEIGATEIPDGSDLVVASPGIPPSSPLLVSAMESGAEVISEIELAWRLSSSAWVAVTGTNGKTTTTALATHLLTSSGVAAEAVGNIGAPAISAVSQAGPGTVLVAEVSSFQLAFTRRFHPRVAVLLNITPDHVDWHGSLDAYSAAKANVFANMTCDDLAVIDVDDPGSAACVGPVAEAGVRVCRVSLTERHAGGAYLAHGVLTLEGAEGPVALIEASELLIKGEHNVRNALAAAAAALGAGATVEGVRLGLGSFLPIEHRLEPVTAVRGVEYFNDSKATNPDAVMKALTAFDDRPVVVLLGGHNKGNDFRDLARAVGERCRLAVLFGESLSEMAAAFEGTTIETRQVAGMAEAVAAAAAVARPGEVVLLSPACASFDEFDSYEHRGRVFKEMVAGMSGDDPAGREEA